MRRFSPTCGTCAPFLPLALLALGACGHESHDVMQAPLECSERTPGDLFAQRIEPLLSQDRPSSCNQCHLSGIELGSFARETACETMACLSEQGLVDLEAPEQSLILSWIKRAAPDSELITAQVIDEEYEGFRAWIEYSASCQAFACAGVTCAERTDAPFCKSENAGVAYDAAADPGDCSDKTLEQLFRDTVYASRGRCFPCHFEEETMADPTAPRWIAQSGSCNNASLLTMRTVVSRGLVNVDEPMKSLLLLKPLGPHNGGVEHGGDAKFQTSGDVGYDNFSYWLERYAGCAK